MKNHTDLLNVIALKINAKSYLEIGTNNCKNFNSIMVAHKVGVDPDTNSPCAIHKTSHEYFKENFIVGVCVSEKEMRSAKQPVEKFDLIFIDGSHFHEDVRWDIENAWECLTENGVIVIHDTNPPNKEMATDIRHTKQWCGSVWKIASQITSPKFTIDFDFGCMIIRKSDKVLSFGHIPFWETFDKDRKNMLHLVSIEEGVKIIEQWI